MGKNATEPERKQALRFFLAYYEDHRMDSTRARTPEFPKRSSISPRSRYHSLNKPVRVSVRILEELGLAKYFRAVYGGNSFGTKKPDPLGAQTILGEFRRRPRRHSDRRFRSRRGNRQRNAGTFAAAVNYGFGTHDRAAHPADIYLNRLTDLVSLLTRPNS